MAYICNCNGFTDNDMRDAVAEKPEITLGELYSLASKGMATRPNCGKCCMEFRDKVAQVTGRAFTKEEFKTFLQSSEEAERVRAEKAERKPAVAA
ncbi:MAG: hypothetical protein GC136_05345 [Alphaproteobacteria bacterium]|nr:hypothetical protein [Alphaproteobacteria bacterium]